MRLKRQPAYIKGLPDDRAFYLSRYGSAANAIEALQSVTDWYDIVSVSGNPTATLEINNRTVTITNGTLRSDGIRAGYIFSPDGGGTWFNISSVPDNASVILSTTPRTLTLTNEAFLIAKPKFVRVIADQMADFEAFYFNVLGNTAAYIECVNACGKVLHPNPALYGNEFEAVTTPMVQGALTMRGFIATQDRVDAGHAIWWIGAALSSADEFTTHYQDAGGRYKFVNVDVYYPSSSIGSVYIKDTYMESAQDICLLNVGKGSFVIEDSKMVGKPHYYEMLQDSLITKHFSRLPDLIKNCEMVIDHTRSDPSGGASVIMATETNGQVPSHPCVVEGGTIRLKAPRNNNIYPIGKWNTDTSAIDVTMNGVTFDDSGIPAGGSIVRPNAYTGTGSLTMNGCDKGGLADGGGGTFSIVTNP